MTGPSRPAGKLPTTMHAVGCCESCFERPRRMSTQPALITLEALPYLFTEHYAADCARSTSRRRLFYMLVGSRVGLVSQCWTTKESSAQSSQCHGALDPAIVCLAAGRLPWKPLASHLTNKGRPHGSIAQIYVDASLGSLGSSHQQ